MEEGRGKEVLLGLVEGEEGKDPVKKKGYDRKPTDGREKDGQKNSG